MYQQDIKNLMLDSLRVSNK